MWMANFGYHRPDLGEKGVEEEDYVEVDSSPTNLTRGEATADGEYVLYREKADKDSIYTAPARIGGRRNDLIDSLHPDDSDDSDDDIAIFIE